MTTRIIGGGGRRSNRIEESISTSANLGSKRAPNPPSRHLWVGNLVEGVTEEEVFFQFSRFGELETVAFQPGRSYAFINYKHRDDAVAALTYLQGGSLAGNPLRIEFAKLDKASASAGERDYNKHYDEVRFSSKGSPLHHRDSRFRDEQFFSEKLKIGEKGGEASEVLWVGFPALLKVDEAILKKAFSPFGDIEKITVFAGRSYAFVRFRSIVSALNAKETLQGKLFGNPRVHICFAKSETGPPSSPLKPRTHSGGSDCFSSRMYPESEFNDSGLYAVDPRAYLHPIERDVVDNWRLRESSGPSKDLYGVQNLHPESSGRLLNHYKDSWEFRSDDNYYTREAKKLKPDPQLADYSFSKINKDSFRTDYHRTYGHNPGSDRLADAHSTHGGRNEFHAGSGSGSGSGSVVGDERKRFTSEAEQSALSLWKWEGTIAKGGTPVCRAHCFPVRKAMNFMLPEFLDCTARTGLDMLAKHYYQASSVWVVFFVPNDADIEYYNEFMHYLEEKQRAAVAKLDDKTTLFLVPPSDFSEKVLKVAGNLSISGVVLRVDNPVANSAPLYPSQRRDSDMRDGKISRGFDSLVGRTSNEERVDYSRQKWSDNPPLDLSKKQSLGSEGEWVSYNEQKMLFPPRDSGDAVVGGYQPPWPPSGSSVSMQSHLGSTHSAYELQENESQMSQGRGFPPETTVAGQAESGTREGGDAQKCLQATLQLAAALLQQIQQGKGSS